MSLYFCPIASGSSGNCIFVGTEATKILIDAGLSGKRIEAGMNDAGFSCLDLDALFITHEHSDHIQGAGVMSRRYDIPIYATPKTWEAIEKSNAIGAIKPKNKLYVYEDENVILNDLCIHPFSIPHDAAQPVGYNVFAEDYKVTLATDFGIPTETIKEKIMGSHILLLESNHDEKMLETGPYPWPLKKRIFAETGHISNVAAGLLLVETYSDDLQYVYLAHLSAENNTPALAYETVFQILSSNNIEVNRDLFLLMAERHKASRVVTLESRVNVE